MRRQTAGRVARPDGATSTAAWSSPSSPPCSPSSPGCGAPAGVAAHAELLEITPADGTLLDAAPAEVVLRWSEPVSITGGSARVLDDTAAVVSDEARVDGTVVTIPISGELADGTYTVAWDVISEDSHPISGATVFYVGAPSTTGPVDAQAGGGRVGGADRRRRSSRRWATPARSWPPVPGGSSSSPGRGARRCGAASAPSPSGPRCSARCRSSRPYRCASPGSAEVSARSATTRCSPSR